MQRRRIDGLSLRAPRFHRRADGHSMEVIAALLEVRDNSTGPGSGAIRKNREK
ncbi:hypothetical protein J2129_001782 [Methanofollis sp. W23]|uniref:hypothetical protein n=1 Tax=Methanofollis sp. W23 TaxID=2817849 RepID=UPI001AE7B1C1|nr:hypothetical protein [Methanofollis sp. W23]MBP2146328.1 hypothetical protein [Methanofollis sp. W23]